MELVIVGAGGHGRVCAEIAEASGRYDSICFSDDRIEKGALAGTWTVRYQDADLPKVNSERTHVFVGVGQTRLGAARQRLWLWLTELGLFTPVLVGPSAQISTSAHVGAGTLIGRMALINTAARVGRNCIINSKALVEHDADVGEHVHVSTGAIVNGDCVIGNRCLIGSNAVINQGIRVCDNVVVGSGCVVTRDITRTGVYAGVPAKRIRDD